MRILSFARLALFAAPLLVAALPALAQQPQPAVPSDSNLSFGGMLAKKPQKASMPDVAAPPSVWPRLDPGAVLCRSQDDLVRRAAIMRGEQAGPADCRPIAQPTGIQIVQRSGPGATEVKVTNSDETGWTDAWLPSSPPPASSPIQAGQLVSGGSPRGR